MVSNITGDTAQQGYLIRNKYNIISGQAPYSYEKAEA